MFHFRGKISNSNVVSAFSEHVRGSEYELLAKMRCSVDTMHENRFLAAAVRVMSLIRSHWNIGGVVFR